MASMYNIMEEHLGIIATLEENDGLFDEQLMASMQLNAEAFEQKAVSYGYVIKKFEDEADLIGAEIARLTSRKKAAENKAERFKTILATAMITLQQEKIKTPLMSIWFRPSKPLEINEDDLDAEWFKEEKKTVPDKDKIKAALAAGQEIVGAKYVAKKNLQIK